MSSMLKREHWIAPVQIWQEYFIFDVTRLLEIQNMSGGVWYILEWYKMPKYFLASLEKFVQILNEVVSEIVSNRRGNPQKPYCECNCLAWGR